MVTRTHEAAQAVLFTPELLEHILSFLPPAQTLTSIRHVCKFFLSLVSSSRYLHSIAWDPFATVTPAVYHASELSEGPEICPFVDILFSFLWKEMCRHPPDYEEWVDNEPDRYSDILKDLLQPRDIPNIYLTSPPLECIDVMVKTTMCQSTMHNRVETTGGVTFMSFAIEMAYMTWHHMYQALKERELSAVEGELCPPWDIMIIINWGIPSCELITEKKRPKALANWIREVQKTEKVGAACVQSGPVIVEEAHRGAFIISFPSLR